MRSPDSTAGTRPRPEPRQPPTVIVTVEIDDECYRVQCLDAAPQRAWQLRKLEGRRAGAVYVVQELPGGQQVCDCPDWQFRRRACKHVLALRIMGALAAPQPEGPGP